MTYLSKMIPARHDKGSLIKAFDILKAVGHDLTKISETLSEQISNDVNVMLDGFLKEQKEILIRHEHGMESATTALNLRSATVEKTEVRYIEKCKKLQKSINAVNRGQTGKMTRAEFQAIQDYAVERKTKMDKSESDFKEAIKLHNESQDAWESSLKLTASAFQDLETKRIDLTKKIILHVITLQEHALVEQTTHVFKSLKQKMNDYIDIQYDIDSYASELSTGTNLAKRQEFRSYFNTAANDFDTTILESLKSKLRRLSQQRNLQPLPPMHIRRVSHQNHFSDANSITTQSFPNTTTLVNEEDVIVSSAAPLESIEENPLPEIPITKIAQLTISPAVTKIDEKDFTSPLSPDSAIAQTPIDATMTTTNSIDYEAEDTTKDDLNVKSEMPMQSNVSEAIVTKSEKAGDVLNREDSKIDFNIPPPPPFAEEIEDKINANETILNNNDNVNNVLTESKAAEVVSDQQESSTPVSTPSIRRVSIQESQPTAISEPIKGESAIKVSTPVLSKPDLAVAGKQASTDRLNPKIAEYHNTFTRKSIKIQGHIELYSTAEEEWESAWALIEGKFIWIFASEEDANKPKGTVKHKATVGLHTLEIANDISEDTISRNDNKQCWNMSVISQWPREQTMALINKSSGKLSQIIVHPSVEQYQKWKETIGEITKLLEIEDQ